MLAVARSLPPVEGAAIEWIEASALDMPLPDAAFDIVLCQQGLQQFPDRPAALREMRRVLQPGGRLTPYLAVPSSAGFKNVLADTSLEVNDQLSVGFLPLDPGTPFDIGVVVGDAANHYDGAFTSQEVK